jgi:iron complex transport system ATP-binding protein
MMGKDTLIAIKELSIGYGNGKRAKTVASGLTAEVNAGELVCLLGPNGAGKSTLLRTLCGFQPCFKGAVELLGNSIAQMNDKAISRLLSVVLTDKVAVTNASVYELVAYGRSPYTGIMGKLTNRDKEIIKNSIAQCGIDHKTHELLSALSDGELQKAFIAKALAQDTPIVLLDEPTAFLDLPARVEIVQLLRNVASESGKSILLSTHDLDLALQMADKLWLLGEEGLISGSPEDLLLSNAFQQMFQNRGVVFDNRTGLFRVEYQHDAKVYVKGHGFEYVLLRRAFARKGVETVPHKNGAKRWIEISVDAARPFLAYDDDELLIAENSIENLVENTLQNAKFLS